jgi:hypothetical protein
MKPIINQINAPCVHCAKDMEHVVHHRIDGESHPELKLKVLDSSAFVTACPHCIGFSSVPQDFRYFDGVGATHYMIYYFPEDSIDQLEDVIAATIGLRRNGTRVHMIHKLTEVVPIISAYERGELPPERLVQVGDQATIRATALSNASDQAMNSLLAATQMQKETGKFPDGFIEGLVEGRQMMKEKPQKKSFFRRLFTGAGDGHDAKPPSLAPSQESKASATNKEVVIHFVIKGPPPGVPRNPNNTLITGVAKRIFEPDGTRKTMFKFYAGSDPLTILEAHSAIYWRDQIENLHLTDQQAIDAMLVIQEHALYKYIVIDEADSIPGEIAITTGLTQLSLHYGIAYLDQLNLPESTVSWMANQQAKGPSFERVVDYKKADGLKQALAHAPVDPVFLNHVRASVAGAKK